MYAHVLGVFINLDTDKDGLLTRHQLIQVRVRVRVRVSTVCLPVCASMCVFMYKHIHTSLSHTNH